MGSVAAPTRDWPPRPRNRRPRRSLTCARVPACECQRAETCPPAAPAPPDYCSERYRGEHRPNTPASLAPIRGFQPNHSNVRPGFGRLSINPERIGAERQHIPKLKRATQRELRSQKLEVSKDEINRLPSTHHGRCVQMTSTSSVAVVTRCERRARNAPGRPRGESRDGQSQANHVGRYIGVLESSVLPSVPVGGRQQLVHAGAWPVA